MRAGPPAVPSTGASAAPRRLLRATVCPRRRASGHRRRAPRPGHALRRARRPRALASASARPDARVSARPADPDRRSAGREHGEHERVVVRDVATPARSGVPAGPPRRSNATSSRIACRACDVQCAGSAASSRRLRLGRRGASGAAENARRQVNRCRQGRARRGAPRGVGGSRRGRARRARLRRRDRLVR